MRGDDLDDGDISGSLRGMLVGATVAALAVAAHGLAGGGYPGSAALTLLLFTAAGIGAVADLLPVPSGMSSRAALLAVLSGGQLAAHLALSVAGASGAAMGSMSMVHESTGIVGLLIAALHLPTGPMSAAHVLATLVCTALIVAAERLYGLVSRAIRTITTGARPPLPQTGPGRWPARSRTTYRFLHAGALGSRAPPVPA